nr:hypothetical protein [Tanacetum cinerariifolium]
MMLYKDAKSLFVAIQTRFGDNEATKKTQKTLLKQMYENFSAPSTESLDYILNRLQKIIVEQEVKGTANSSSNSQNMTFVSSPSSTNEVNTAYGPEFEGYGPKTSKSISKDISNEVKEYLDAPLVNDRVSDNKHCSVESPVVVEKKTVVSTVAKIEFVRAKQQEKLVRKPVKPRPINTARPRSVNTARPRPVNTARPNLIVVNAVSVNQVKTINREKQIQVLVDKKKVIITETSVRSDLHLEVAEDDSNLRSNDANDDGGDSADDGNKSAPNNSVDSPSNSTVDEVTKDHVHTKTDNSDTA